MLPAYVMQQMESVVCSRIGEADSISSSTRPPNCSFPSEFRGNGSALGVKTGPTFVKTMEAQHLHIFTAPYRFPHTFRASLKL